MESAVGKNIVSTSTFRIFEKYIVAVYRFPGYTIIISLTEEMVLEHELQFEIYLIPSFILFYLRVILS